MTKRIHEIKGSTAYINENMKNKDTQNNYDANNQKHHNADDLTNKKQYVL